MLIGVLCLPAQTGSLHGHATAPLVAAPVPAVVAADYDSTACAVARTQPPSSSISPLPLLL